MGVFLESLRRPNAGHLIEQTPDGFAVVRREAGCAEDFDRLAREIIQRSGADYAALPHTDGRAGYERVFIIPID